MRVCAAVALVLVALGVASAAITCPSAITLQGTSANDVLVGTAGNDRIVGNGGQDTIRGLGGSDCLFGGSFDDKLFGGDGDDELIGEGGNDLLDGGPGDDFLNGGSGNDILIGGPGKDTIVGEGGDDTFIIHAGDVPAGQTETLNGGDGIDTAQFDFDPGHVVPPTFTVTDPVTGGKYRFFDTERVVVRVCGNGTVEVGEECDDGNTISGDGCDANCTRTRCGNGIVTPNTGEQCDDGNTVGGDGCSATCKLECGNGVLDPGEQCDDGNRVNGDGCDANCTFPACGNGILDAGEACDDGNTVGGDGCSSTCQLECGNGVLDAGEQCDDGNRVGGDGCSATCQLECPSALSCDDGNPCTADTCENGMCVHGPLAPFPDAACQVGTLAHLPECAQDHLGSTLALSERVRKVQALIRRASHVQDNANLVLQAERVLALVGTRSARLASHGKISAACGAALTARAAELAAQISAL